MSSPPMRPTSQFFWELVTPPYRKFNRKNIDTHLICGLTLLAQACCTCLHCMCYVFVFFVCGFALHMIYFCIGFLHITILFTIFTHIIHLFWREIITWFIYNYIHIWFLQNSFIFMWVLHGSFMFIFMLYSPSYGHILLRWCCVFALCMLCMIRTWHVTTCNDMKCLKCFIHHVKCMWFFSLIVISKHDHTGVFLHLSSHDSEEIKCHFRDLCSVRCSFIILTEWTSEWMKSVKFGWKINLIYCLWNIKYLFISVQRWETDEGKGKSTSCWFFSRL